MSPGHVAAPCRPVQYTRRDLSLRYVATKSCCNWSPDLYTWSDLSLRRVAATCRLVCTDLKLRRPEPIYIFVRCLRSVHTRRQVAATCRGDILQLQIASCVLENFCENLYRCNRICRRNKSHRFSLIWFFATCCSDKILLRRQRFSQKFSSTYEAICRCDVSPYLVAATSRQTCTHGVIGRRDVLLQLVV